MTTPEREAVKKAVSTLKSGIKIAAHTGVPISGDNLIYCSTVNLTWNALSEYAGGQITFPERCASVDFLNSRAFTKKHLDESCYMALAGMVGQGVIEQIKQELKERFSETSKCDSSHD